MQCATLKKQERQGDRNYVISSRCIRLQAILFHRTLATRTKALSQNWKPIMKTDYGVSIPLRIGNYTIKLKRVKTKYQNIRQKTHICHPGAGRGPLRRRHHLIIAAQQWIPAYAGMTILTHCYITSPILIISLVKSRQSGFCFIINFNFQLRCHSFIWRSRFTMASGLPTCS